MNMMTACCCQRTKRRWGQVQCCHRYIHKHKISCAHTYECTGYTELRSNSLRSSPNVSYTSSFYIWADERRGVRTCYVWLEALCRKLVFSVESCQVECHPILEKQDEQDHESKTFHSFSFHESKHFSQMYHNRHRYLLVSHKRYKIVSKVCTNLVWT